MPRPRIEQLVGTIDGVNTTFTTPDPYVPGSFTGIIDGLPRVRTNDDGWTETDPGTGTVDFTEAPLPGSVLQGFYLDTTPALPGETITEVTGQLIDLDSLTGVLADTAAVTAQLVDTDALTGALTDTDSVEGTLDDIDNVGGQLVDVDALTGQVQDC